MVVELTSYAQEEFSGVMLNRKERVTVDLIRNGLDFLEQFEINEDLKMDVVSMIYQFLKYCDKIPHNLYKFYIAAYYITCRHPIAFPVHASKKQYCEKFGIKTSSLEYCVQKIVDALGLIKILDDMNYPYFIDPKGDLIHSISKTIVKERVKSAHMSFLLHSQPLNANILCEDIVTSLVFERKLFPEELFRQFYEIIQDLVLEELQEQDFNKYLSLQQNYLI